MNVTRLAVLNTLATLTVAWLPTTDKTITSSNGTDLFKASHGKIRGVNLGSQFVFEPWIATKAWSELGCEGQESEFDCVMKLGQDAANKAFAKHWDSWITKEDIKEIRSYGLNTIRIPVGYWMNEDLIYHDSEYFPHGGFAYLEKLCGWASDAGLYIIIDLHGAPGAQVAKNAFTGQFADTPGFYVDFQYQRALEFLEWMTIKVHTLHNFRNVGMLEVVNEPVQNPQVTTTLRSNYYPNAFHTIRKVEGALSIDRKDYLHIQMMDGAWGAGDPHEHLTDDYYAAYDNHRYLKWDPRVEVSKESYIKTSCNDNVATNWPAIIGEWSLGVPDNVQETADWKPYSNLDFYQKWFAAQVQNYEQHQGWIFWTWKTQLGEYRWSYRDGVKAGVIPTDLNAVFREDVCKGRSS
ncbi:putative glucan endo-1,6-beta-glucosidase B [Aspergillus minisclerotigenes]|uniref:Probable glucan endo-1,6-beta-glucosidase B n=1 Tax=Aspergillus minisclerotigenes TaxID=656917 RepID=A0A5N6J1Q8_9EURO|nr:putative glucan endo-1,6-beta-glucosidase B [Aspergillus minisclerotigenes]